MEGESDPNDYDEMDNLSQEHKGGKPRVQHSIKFHIQIVCCLEI